MKARNAQIDLLRLVAMLMIICGHLIYHGIQHVAGPQTTPVPFADSTAGQFNFVWLQFLGLACGIATNIYFMITGYFLVKPRPMSYAVSKSFKQWKTIVFYTLSIYALLCVAGIQHFSLSQTLEQLTPIHSRQYWFMSTYIVVVLLSPFVSKALDTLSKKEYHGLLAVLLLLNFAEGSIGYGGIFSGSMSLMLAISMFCVGGYLRRYPLPRFRNDHIVYLSLYLLTFLLLTLYSYFGQTYHLIGHGTPMHLKGLANNSLPLFASISVFIAFVSHQYSIPAYVSHFSVAASPYILAVYLIHDNKYIRPLLWDTIVQPLNHINSYWLLPYSLAVVVGIFALCLAVEWGRQKVVQLRLSDKPTKA